MIAFITVQDALNLAVPIKGAAKGTALSRLLALKASPGWLVTGEEVSEWRFEGIAPESDRIFIYGPRETGTSLEAALDLSASGSLPLLTRLVDALLVLMEKGIALPALQTDAILFTEPGGVLFLPPEVMREVRAQRTFEENRDTFLVITHPDLKAQAGASFSIAALLYRILTGEFPFAGASEEEIHERARKLRIIAPRDVSAEVPGDLSDTVMAGLGGSKRGAASIREWAERLGTWQTLAVSPTHPRKATALRQQSERKFRRRIYFEKNGKLIAILTVVAVALGIGTTTYVKRMTAPRVTRGYSPQKVVETFYTSMNSFDGQTMEACVVGKAGKAEINEALTLYVMSQVSVGYGGSSNIESADEWNRKGRPTLESGKTLYGVTNMSIVQQHGEPDPVFLVKYEKWVPLPNENAGRVPVPAVMQRSAGNYLTDLVSLKQDRGDWVIYAIDRLSSEPVPK